MGGVDEEENHGDDEEDEDGDDQHDNIHVSHAGSAK